MTSKTVKELWRIEGKHQIGGDRVQNIIYGYSGNPLVPYDQIEAEPDYCIFLVVTQDGTETGWLFNNDPYDGIRISDRLKAFVENNGDYRIFYHDANAHIARTNKSQRVELQDLLYAFHYGISAEQAKAAHVRMLDTNASPICGGQFFDLTWGNLVSDDTLSTVFFIGTGDSQRMGAILQGENTLCIHVQGKDHDHDYNFRTQFTPEICYVLNKVTNAGSWNVSKAGALYVNFSKGCGVAFAEIVGTFYRGEIDLKNPIDSIIENHSKLMAKKAEKAEKIVYDHLTHNEQNNFPWALAPIPETLNKQMQARDRIRPPYFFNTIYDATIKKYRVKFGVYGLWERRYLFDDLAYRNDTNDVFTPRYDPADRKPGKDSLYATIYTRFKEKIGTNNMNVQTSYLSHWADPERAFKPGNMYTDMLSEPVETYRDALGAWIEDGQSLDNMPIVD